MRQVFTKAPYKKLAVGSLQLARTIFSVLTANFLILLHGFAHPLLHRSFFFVIL